jgi:hypothetical protein
MSMELRHGEVTYWEQADWAMGASEMVRTNKIVILSLANASFRNTYYHRHLDRNVAPSLPGRSKREWQQSVGSVVGPRRSFR